MNYPRALLVDHRLAVPVALAAVFAAQCLWFVGTQSLTYDEPVHLATGIELWEHGHVERWNDQPPLARLLLSAPILTSADRWNLHDDGPTAANFWTFHVRDPDQLAWRTRPVNVALGLLLAATLWLAARSYFSELSATFALALLALSPPLIAHFSLATVDGLAVVCFFAATLALVAWLRRPSWLMTVALGAVLGAYLLSKFSAPPIAAVMITIAAMTRSSLPWRTRMVKLAAASCIGAVLVWSAYGFQIDAITFRGGDLSGPYAPAHTVVVPLSGMAPHTMQVPAADYLSAWGGVVQHATRGQPASLLGETRRRGGWRTYYPAVAILKWPLLVLLIAAVALVSAFRQRRWTTDFVILFGLPALYFAIATTSNLDVGDRYILPVYPFLLLACAGAYRALEGRQWLRPAVAVLIVLQAVDCWRYAPDYLSYMNVFVPSDRPYALLSDSNLDWGQGLIALRRYQRTHSSEELHLAYFGGVDPAAYGLSSIPLGEHDCATGTVVVSATHLAGQYLNDPHAYRWLLEYPPKAILNHSLYVFDAKACVRAATTIGK